MVIIVKSQSICLELGTLCLYTICDFGFSKIGLHSDVKLLYTLVGDPSALVDLTPKFPLQSLNRQLQQLAVAPHRGAAERACAVGGFAGHAGCSETCASGI